MNSHLTSEQITRALVGDAAPDELEHGRTCEECRVALTGMSVSLSHLREAVTSWAELQDAGRMSEVRQLAAPPAGFKWRWALVGSTVAVAAMLPLMLDLRPKAPSFDPAQDELLLNEVRSHIRRIAPTPMEPLQSHITDHNSNEGELK